MYFVPPPPSDDRDIALGQFMYEWGKLEMQLLLLFHILTGTTLQIASTIFSTGFQSVNLADLFIALGQIRLVEQEQQKLKNLCKRYRNAAGKRNKIVHGTWYIEPDPDSPKLSQWTRIYSPTNPTIQEKIFNKHNQKVRSTYRYTLPQLQTASNQIKTLSSDMHEFSGLIWHQLYPDELP